MACYRSGGCGPYEMLSCSECPASKPEYLKKNVCANQKKETTGLTDFLGNEIQLLPCPCCGGEAKIIFNNDGDGDEYSFVECQKCGLQTPGFYSYPREPYGWEKAKACWNKRVLS